MAKAVSKKTSPPVKLSFVAKRIMTKRNGPAEYEIDVQIKCKSKSEQDEAQRYLDGM